MPVSACDHHTCHARHSTTCHRTHCKQQQHYVLKPVDGCSIASNAAAVFPPDTQKSCTSMEGAVRGSGSAGPAFQLRELLKPLRGCTCILIRAAGCNSKRAKKHGGISRLAAAIAHRAVEHYNSCCSSRQPLIAFAVAPQNINQVGRAAGGVLDFDVGLIATHSSRSRRGWRHTDDCCFGIGHARRRRTVFHMEPVCTRGQLLYPVSTGCAACTDTMPMPSSPLPLQKSVTRPAVLLHDDVPVSTTHLCV